MKNGNWVPISKGFTKDLPHDRAYTELEAMYSIQCDYDEGNAVTVAGFADLWRWSRNRVRGFLDKTGIEIVYPDMTMKIRNQKGHISIHKMDINGTYNGHKRIIDNKQLDLAMDKKRTKDGHKKDISRSTTIETDTKTKTKTTDIVYPDWLNKDLWKEYKKYRTKIKSPLTDHAEKLSLTALEGLIKDGNDQTKVINKTILSGKWTSFYAVKNPSQPTSVRTTTPDMAWKKNLEGWEREAT